MKKASISLCSIFTFTNALFLSLGIECLLYLLVTVMSPFQEELPKIIPLCAVLGIVALSGLIGVLILSIKFSEKFQFPRAVWFIQYIGGFVLSIPMLKLWELLFDSLEKSF